MHACVVLHESEKTDCVCEWVAAVACTHAAECVSIQEGVCVFVCMHVFHYAHSFVSQNVIPNNRLEEKDLPCLCINERP